MGWNVTMKFSFVIYFFYPKTMHITMQHWMNTPTIIMLKQFEKINDAYMYIEWTSAFHIVNAPNIFFYTILKS